MRLSNSEMATFRRCKRKWWLSHYRRLQPRASAAAGSPISIGNLVHDALAQYYDPDLRVDPVRWAEFRVQDVIAEEPMFEIEITKEWSLVEIMLTGYMEWLAETGADSDLKLLGSERVVAVDIDAKLDEPLTLISKLDAPVEQISDGARLVLEHKTVSSLDQPLPKLKLDTQLLTEHLVRYLHAREEGATHEEAEDKCHGVLYNMLRKVKQTAAAKPPFYGRVTVPHNTYELRNHWLHVVGIAEEIVRTQKRLTLGESHHRVVPPSPGESCKWSCQFFRICAMFDDNSQVEAAVDAMFEERDPLERYEGARDI